MQECSCRKVTNANIPGVGIVNICAISCPLAYASFKPKKASNTIMLRINFTNFILILFIVKIKVKIVFH